MIQLNPLGTHRSTGRTWTVVLAGGEGARLSPTIERWLGEKRPKQYCTFVGRRSMLQHTLDRARRLAPPERMVTVIGRHHGRYVRDAVGDPRPGLWLRQPRNRGTAAGVFLALTHVLARDPQAIVALLPSDHFIWPEDRFVRRMRQALAAVRGSGRMILLGARAHRQSAVMPLDGVEWCDWGRPERIAETMETLGQEPAFMQPAARARRASLAPLPAERG